MLVKLFVSLCDASPRLKKWLWQRWYDHLARAYTGSDWSFMNYGYAPADDSRLDLPAGLEADRYAVQLYHALACRGDLRGKRVLEVGCGRGGGAEYVSRFFAPAETIGVDYSSRAIEICTARRSAPGLRFLRGDAEALPLEDASVDVVINVESSHCYGDMPRFLSEVNRVLVPGGLFLFADLRQKHELALLDRLLGQSGLVRLEREDITPAVLRSIELDDARKRAFVRKLVHPRLLRAFQEFAGVRNSKIERLLAEGGIVYQRFTLRKN